jgi:hypothetical protein
MTKGTSEASPELLDQPEEVAVGHHDTSVVADHLGVIWPIQLVEAGTRHVALPLAEYNRSVRVNLKDLIANLIADQPVSIVQTYCTRWDRVGHASIAALIQATDSNFYGTTGGGVKLQLRRQLWG